MKILTKTKYEAILNRITAKNKIICKQQKLLKQQADLIEAQRKFISSHISHLDTTHDIDFPNSERKEDYESSNIFDL